MTGKYGLAAIDAVNLVRENVTNNPRNAWEIALSKYYEKNSDGLKKGCPKETFLGICSEGLIKGISRGHYTDSKKNKAYGVTAIEMLKKNSNLAENKAELWRQIPNRSAKNQNGQLDVVIALWDEEMI